MNDIMHDVVIIGGGPAGLTAAIYTAREGLRTLLLEKGLCGGLPAVTDLVENYPGFPDGIMGMELVDKFKKQAQRFGANIIEFKGVESIKPSGQVIKVQTAKEEYSAYAVIAASGSIPRRLNIPGEEKYIGKGVSYCAICDGPLFKNKDILVVGGGNAAVGEALFLAKFARRVTLVHRRHEFLAAKIFQERLQRDEGINLLLNHTLTSINGDELVSSVTVKDGQTGEEKILKVSGVFIYIGFSPNSKFLDGVAELDASGYVKTDRKMQASVPGIYAAGDVCSKDARQIVAACGEAAVAAIFARDYIREIKA